MIGVLIATMVIESDGGTMLGSSISAKWGWCAPYIQSILRIVAAIMFMQAGGMKLFAFPIGLPSGGSIPAFSQAWFAGMLETFGGGLLLLGLFTRPVAFIVSGEMAVAYFQVHFPRGWWTIANGGTDAVFYCFLWLYFSAAGGGKWSLDAKLRKS